MTQAPPMIVYFTGAPLSTAKFLSLMEGRAVMYSFVQRRRSAYSDLSRFSSVALDSGAFSVHRRGAQIDIGEYADYCAAVAPRVAWYANLDCIADWRATLRNQRFLERRGLIPVPVWHVGEPDSLLDDLAASYPRVGIGRGPRVNFAELVRGLDRVFARHADSSGRPLCRFHGFRMTDRRLIARYPFHSVDSTTWNAGAAYDELPTDTGRARGFSFLPDDLKTLVWLHFFDSAPKASCFKPALQRCASCTPGDPR